MADVKLNAEVREERGTGAARKLRREGLVPAILYGDGKDSISLKVNYKELYTALHTRGGEHTILDLQVEGGDIKKPLKKTVIVKEVQHDYLKDAILHVDFAVISLKEKIVVKVPIAETGEAKGVSQGGVIGHILRELEVECLPADIPENIVIDITALNIGDSIKVSDIAPPPSVKFLNDPDLTVITLTPPRVEEVAEPTAEVAAEAVEAEAPEGEEKKEEEKGKEDK